MEDHISVFADHNLYDHVWDVELIVGELHGGVPLDPRKAEGWIRSALGETAEQYAARVIQDHLADLEETDIEKAQDAALAAAVDLRTMNGFKRFSEDHSDFSKQLYIEGRQVKAMLKENANIQWPKRRWGISKKGTRSWWAEHVFVAENRIPLGIVEPSGLAQSFVQTWRGSSIKYEEYVTDAHIGFTVVSDTDIGRDDWATLFVSAEKNGLGASRSTGVGTFVVTRFDKR